jgi:hypothetical protein
MRALRQSHKVRSDGDPYAENRSSVAVEDDYAGGGHVEHDWDPFADDSK